jgi:hypothetical protein
LAVAMEPLIASSAYSPYCLEEQFWEVHMRNPE